MRHEYGDLDAEELGLCISMDALSVRRALARHQFEAADGLGHDGFAPAVEMYDLPAGDVVPGLTARRAIALADFAAAEPDRWRLLRMLYAAPPVPLERAAEVLGISARTARRLARVPDLSFNQAAEAAETEADDETGDMAGGEFEAALGGARGGDAWLNNCVLQVMP
ncbi:MAG: hypothetical protein VB042_05290 [Victivallaceae bacterium]|nr:hypothetical protein [Victivallaceae bacterium]